MKRRRISPQAARKLQSQWIQTVQRGRPAYLLTRIPLFFLVLLVAGGGCIYALEGSLTLLLHRPLLMLGLLSWLALVSALVPIWQYRLIHSAVTPRR